MHEVWVKVCIATCQSQPCRQELITALHAEPKSSMVHSFYSAKRLTTTQHSSQRPQMKLLIVAMQVMVFSCSVLQEPHFAEIVTPAPVILNCTHINIYT